MTEKRRREVAKKRTKAGKPTRFSTARDGLKARPSESVRRRRAIQTLKMAGMIPRGRR